MCGFIYQLLEPKALKSSSDVVGWVLDETDIKVPCD